MCTAAIPDNLYCITEPARWLRRWIARHGAEIVVDPRVLAPIAADRINRTLFLPPGHSFDTFYKLISRGLLYLEHGPQWAPEFVERPNCATEDRDAQIIQLRRPW